MISKCRLNQEKVSMDGYNTSKKNLILKGMASVDTGKLRSTGSRAWPRSRDEMWAEACEAWRADNSWELRKGVNQAAAFHAPGNIQQGWQQMTVTWKQKSHSLLIFSIIVLANWVFFFFFKPPPSLAVSMWHRVSLWKPQWGNLILLKMGVLSP